MSIHNVKPILELLPESEKFIKEAQHEGMSTSDVASAMYSFLEKEYLMKVAGHSVDLDSAIRVATAVKLFGLEKEAKLLSEEMVKRASVKDTSEEETLAMVKLAEQIISDQVTGFKKDLEEIVKKAEALKDEYGDMVTSSVVNLYAGDVVLNKSAAVQFLEARAMITGNEAYENAANLLKQASTDDWGREENSRLAHAVVALDKKAGLVEQGMDFYREAFISKEAAMSALSVKLAGQNVPVEKLVKLGKSRIGDALGKDVAESMGEDPTTMKQVAETLPLDLQRLLLSLTKAV